MKNVIAALTDHPVLVLFGKLVTMVLMTATLTYIVLQLYAFQQAQDMRQQNAAEILEAIREARTDRIIIVQRLDELERTMWGEIWPKVEQTKERIVVVPTLRNRDQEILKRLSSLEQRLLRHLSEAH